MCGEKMTQRILVTGATGFIGENFCRTAKSSGDFEIAVLVRDADKLKKDLPVSRIFELNSSFDDLNSFVEDFRPDAIFHLASLFIANHRSEDIIPLIQSNIEFGSLLLETAANARVKYFINIGSSWQTAVPDSPDYSPMDLYAATKQAFEDVLLFYCRQTGMKSVTLRLFDTYGNGDPRRKLLQLLAESMKTGEPLAMSPGEQQIDLVHVSDVCRAMVTAFRKLKAGQLESGSVYAVRGDRPVSLRRFVELAETAAGKKMNIEWGGRPYRKNEIMKTNKALPSLPGWSPEIPLHDGLKKYFS